MNLLKGLFRFIIGFGCTAFFLYWILAKFIEINDFIGILILILSILVGVSSAFSKDDDKQIEK